MYVSELDPRVDAGVAVYAVSKHMMCMTKIE
jgi:hypothetical protein